MTLKVNKNLVQLSQSGRVTFYSNYGYTFSCFDHSIIICERDNQSAIQTPRQTTHDGRPIGRAYA